MDKTKKASMLLHACCAPCITHPVQQLKLSFRVTAYFYNPNIHPMEEYMKRVQEIKKLARRWRFPLIIGDYECEDWFKRIKGFEEELEGGARCRTCYDMRLDRAARKAKELGFECFTTTLSISPHKNASTINEIGKTIEQTCGVKYHEADFKKKDGFKISCRMSEKERLYRQDYCGCVFSRRTEI